MLLAELAPRDIRQLFICHKQLFYQLYRAWSETKRSYVVDFLTREYQVDKAGARAALFGHEPPMQEPGDDLIASGGDEGKVVLYSSGGVKRGEVPLRLGAEQDNFLRY